MAWTVVDLTFLIIVVGGIGGVFVTLCCWNMRRSRCTHVDCLCFHCKRELMSASMLAADTAETMDIIKQQHEQVNQHTTQSRRPSAATSRCSHEDTAV